MLQTVPSEFRVESAALRRSAGDSWKPSRGRPSAAVCGEQSDGFLRCSLSPSIHGCPLTGPRRPRFRAGFLLTMACAVTLARRPLKRAKPDTGGDQPEGVSVAWPAITVFVVMFASLAARVVMIFVRGTLTVDVFHRFTPQHPAWKQCWTACEDLVRGIDGATVLVSALLWLGMLVLTILSLRRDAERAFPGVYAGVLLLIAWAINCAAQRFHAATSILPQGATAAVDAQLKRIAASIQEAAAGTYESAERLATGRSRHRGRSIVVGEEFGADLTPS